MLHRLCNAAILTLHAIMLQLSMPSANDVNFLHDIRALPEVSLVSQKAGVVTGICTLLL